MMNIYSLKPEKSQLIKLIDVIKSITKVSAIFEMGDIRARRNTCN